MLVSRDAIFSYIFFIFIMSCSGNSWNNDEQDSYFKMTNHRISLLSSAFFLEYLNFQKIQPKRGEVHYQWNVSMLLSGISFVSDPQTGGWKEIVALGLQPASEDATLDEISDQAVSYFQFPLEDSSNGKFGFFLNFFFKIVI